MSYFEKNIGLNGIELHFDRSLNEKEIALLKLFGFRWNKKKYVWYKKWTKESEAIAELIVDDDFNVDEYCGQILSEPILQIKDFPKLLDESQIDKAEKINDSKKQFDINELHQAIGDGVVKIEKISKGYILKYLDAKIIIKDGFASVRHNNIIKEYGKKEAELLVKIIEKAKAQNKLTISDNKTAVSFAITRKISGNEIIVTGNLKKCFSNHTTEDIGAELLLCNHDGDIVKKVVAATYCEECNAYFIYDKVINNIRKYGHILARIIDRNSFFEVHKLTTINGMMLKDIGPLKEMGYNVSKTSNLTDVQRQALLGYMVDNSIMSRNRIVDYLRMFIELNHKRLNNSDAIEKWEMDIDFVSHYKINELRWQKFY